MQEFHYAKEQVIARTFHKAFRLIKKYLLLGLMAVVSLDAQQSSPPATAWTGVVRAAAGEPVAGAKVTVYPPTAKENLTAVTGADGKFAIADIRLGPHTVTVQLPGQGPTTPVTVNISSASVALTVSDQNVLSIAVNPQAAAKVSNVASGTSDEKLSSQKVNELPLNGRDFSTLLLLAAGTMTDVNGQTNFTQQFAINGQRGVEAVFAMDGADMSDPEMGGSTFTNFDVDAIQELQSSFGLDASRHRARRGRLYQYRDTIREERISRFLLRVSKELCPRCAKLFRSPVDCGPGPNPSVPAKRVRIY